MLPCGSLYNWNIIQYPPEENGRSRVFPPFPAAGSGVSFKITISLKLFHIGQKTKLGFNA